MLENEIWNHAKLDHKYIIQLHGASDVDKDDVWIVMELFEGRELRAEMDQRFFAVKSEPFSTEEILTIIHQVCSALAHIESKQIVHRDIKPENILIQIKDGVPLLDSIRVKIIDFGFSHVVGDHFHKSGTPGFVPREFQTAGPKADVFAAGIIMWELSMRKWKYLYAKFPILVDGK